MTWGRRPGSGAAPDAKRQVAAWVMVTSEQGRWRFARAVRHGPVARHPNSARITTRPNAQPTTQQHPTQAHHALVPVRQEPLGSV
jgi:hypothetical protein